MLNTNRIIDETITELEKINKICLNNEKDRIANLIHEMISEFPQLELLDTSSMSYTDVLKFIAEQCENINYSSSHSEHDEFEIILNNQNPNPKVTSLFFLLFLIFATKNRAITFCFGLGNIKRHKPQECEALRLISDNSVSIQDTKNNTLKFICSIESALSDYILENNSELHDIDDFLFSKQQGKMSVADYFEKREAGINLNKNKESHKTVTGIAERFIQNSDMYLFKKKNKIKLLKK